MAKVILDVPNDKMQPFLKAVLRLGIDRHTIRSNRKKRSLQLHEQNALHKIASSFILFDWEFFCNELEYE
ncbi:MAG: hypothetical protein B7Y15_07800 [Bacteroidetes bacterium 24-39-8]|jgi:hypothetical protein|nr:MAG: hypothetical protein B7Y69_05925 [Sphingobacteriia bacterium 35-40-8]OYZ50903.1 MAG: hypothetical protein B7Y15_07800 [Bacteroidetes bacterium 24-39-8]OZA62203.1 MAG: hypothetical protein B7X72_12590 [Sphingobacteriia bacterium 39-39-8]HQR94267.1 hypothetical protein [Sediminibacterium sp.]HQS55961.1 hypothetical protein [Sediminibacterium sp.]